MMTTYPLAANSSGFQRYDQSSPQAPSGPPWMRYFRGYFLAASNPGGRMMKPCTLSLFAPWNQNDSMGCRAICDSTGSFSMVSGLAFESRQSGTLYAFGG